MFDQSPLNSDPVIENEALNFNLDGSFEKLEKQN